MVIWGGGKLARRPGAGRPGQKAGLCPPTTGVYDQASALHMYTVAPAHTPSYTHNNFLKCPRFTHATDLLPGFKIKLLLASLVNLN